MKETVIPAVCLSLTLALSMLVACGQQDAEVDEPARQSLLNDVKSKLESVDPIQRQAPFVLREFSPVMNGEWIGNAVSYGCYRQGQAPGVAGPSEAEILEDLNIIQQHWSLIRVYGADDDAERILGVIEQHDLPIRMMLGIWLEPEEGDSVHAATNTEQVLRGIELANRYSDIVMAVNVGNETQVFWSAHRMKASTLIRYLRAVRNNVSVPVTTADDYNFWNKPESQAVADEVDFVVTHIYPLWNGKTLNEAIGWMDQIYREIQTAHPDRIVAIGEIGWATNYNADKTGPGEQGTLVKGEVGYDAQAEFLISLDRWVRDNRVTCFLFEAFDEPWKGGGESSPPNEIEKHWGVYYEDRTPKASFQEFLSVTDGLRQ
ncbi:glycosyl hydrolase family 17 [candidate division GN15 bacterium]|nr:glycosyl hydrolase family 17 [candidate division GN15 bacterium]